jgi:hypothetical protein
MTIKRLISLLSYIRSLYQQRYTIVWISSVLVRGSEITRFHSHHGRMAARNPKLGEDLEKAAELELCGLPQSPNSRSHGVSNISIRPCPSAGALAPELTSFSTLHTASLGSHGSYSSPPYNWGNRLPDHTKAGLCVVSTSGPRPGTSEDRSIDVNSIQAFIVCTLQNRVAHAGKQIMESEQPADLQELLHQYCKIFQTYFV